MLKAVRGEDSHPSFSVISGAQVNAALEGKQREIVDLIEKTYRLHGEGSTVNPPSYFLRFPDRATSRIIALPASVGGDIRLDGLKWISSFPDNLARGIPRASAVLILNDHDTGYPFACLESSIISAVRTAASAALAADRLSRQQAGIDRSRPTRVGFFGVGLIARFIHSYLLATGWTFTETGVFDLSPDSADGFRSYLTRTGRDENIVVHSTPADLIRSSDLVVFATTSASPHVTDPDWFAHNPLVLHISLRDLAPDIVLSATNVVDDIDHCLKANTSLHLAEQEVGHRDFVNGTLCDVLTGKLKPPTDRPVIFSPFGLGVLDIAVGGYVYSELARSGGLRTVDDFFHELDRYGRQ